MCNVPRGQKPFMSAGARNTHTTRHVTIKDQHFTTGVRRPFGFLTCPVWGCLAAPAAARSGASSP